MDRVSPGITINEKDLTTIVPAVATTRAAIVGLFRWGPVNKPILITSDTRLAASFGAPTNFNAQTYFTASSFLNYSNALQVVRTANTTGATGDVANTTLSAVVNTGTTSNTVLLGATVKNLDDYTAKDGTFDSSVLYIAKYPGALGSSLKVSVCDSANAYTSAFDLAPNANFNTNTVISFTMNSNSALALFTHSVSGSNTDTAAISAAFAAALTPGDLIKVGNTTLGTQYMKISTVGSATSVNVTTHAVSLSFSDKYYLGADYSSNNVTRYWEFYRAVNHTPGQSNYVASFGNTSANDALHVVIVDEDGKFTGVPGTVLEKFEDMSRATDAKDDTGQTIYYKDVLNTKSAYLWWANDRSGSASANSTNVVSASSSKPLSQSFVGGQDGACTEATIPVSVLTAGWEFFRNKAEVDVSLLLAGLARGTNGVTLANFLINLCQERKDCMVFISPEASDVVNAINSEATNLAEFRGYLTNSSYAVMDGNYKYMYDKYNDVYRWVPFNGDVGGLVARTELTNDAWWSPGGFNRGQLANVVKLAWNPSEPERDLLYKADINPICSFPGQGTILYGDKTLLGKPSAFDRINVRRLFIVLEKAIEASSRYTLFEFNDEFTRAQFRNIVEPYLRTVKGRRGITAFQVVCDSTNNTAQVIDSNQFIGDIYIKPNRSINFITLNFVATPTGVSFNEIIGA